MSLLISRHSAPLRDSGSDEEGFEEKGGNPTPQPLVWALNIRRYIDITLFFRSQHAIAGIGRSVQALSVSAQQI